MRNLGLRAKLGLGFGSLLLLIVTIGIVSYVQVDRLDDISVAARSAATKRKQTYQIEISIEKQTSGVHGFLLAGQENLLAISEEGRQEFQKNADALAPTLITEEGKRVFAQILEDEKAFRSRMDEEIRLRREGKTQEAISLAFSPETSALRTALRQSVARMLELENGLAESAQKAQADTEDSLKVMTLALAGIGIALGAVIAFFLGRSLARDVLKMHAMVQEVASNNLAVEDLDIASRDEIGQAGEALNRMKNNLKGIVHSIAETAEHVASASEEISSSAAQQAQGAETQNNQAAQVATAMQEMSSTVLQVSENSNKAAEASRNAAETARKGGLIVEDTLAKMKAIADSVSATARKVEELGKSSDQIGRIIGVIDDIADQTNLLALNAAIEAARAGEQGRGFAVVADEVRKLAERTTTATKEIAQMIRNIQDETKVAVTAMESGTKQVQEGVKSTAEAGDALKEIISMSEQVGEMITHIATAATEQSSASEEVNSNMDQIARLVKESAEGAQQSAKACQDLSGLALDLQKMVGNFRTDKNGGGQSHSQLHSTGLSGSAPHRPKSFAAGAGR